MPSSNTELDKDVRELRFQLENANRGIAEAQAKIAVFDRNIGNIIKNVTNIPAAPVANLIFNGEIGHSVNSWFDDAYTTDDKSKEAAHWFSHDGTLSGLALDETDARTNSTNKTLKEISHSTYSNDYGRWDSANGWAEITGTKTIDNLLPANLIDATTSLARVSMVAARRSQYIEIPANSLMFAGIYDNTAGQLKFLTGSLGFTAGLVGAAGSVERRFKIHVISDRGFSIVSPEIVIPNAPANGEFSATRNITLSWKLAAGQLRVDIYEYVPSTGIYRLIEEVSSGNGFIYQGNALRTASGYPVSSIFERTAIYYTRGGEASGLAINGLTPRWDTVNFPVQIPDNYNKSLTTGRQWLRIGFTIAANLLVAGCTANGTTTLQAPAEVFEDAYSDDYAGLVAQILNADGEIIQTTSVVSRTDETHIVLAGTVAAGTVGLRLVGGGFHGVLIDKIHLGFQQNTSYAPNAYDVRVLQPIAAPESSTQGGVGGGGLGGGIFCVARKTPIKQAGGDWQAIENCNHGQTWASAEFRPNLLIKLTLGFEFVRTVRAANGCFIECTDTERFVCDRNDVEGTPLHRLRVGDYVLTEIDDRIESSRIVEISGYSREKENVYTPLLSGNRLFIAGEVKEKWYERIWRFFKNFRRRKGGFILHNRKYDPDFEPPTL